MFESSITLTQLIPTVQTAIGPVILISGEGLLLLTMTNRLGRTTDRARMLENDRAHLALDQRQNIDVQLHILWKRAQQLRLAIIFVVFSSLSAALLIIVLFLTSLLHAGFVWAIAGLFIICLSLLITSLILFICEVNESLEALKLELGK